MKKRICIFVLSMIVVLTNTLGIVHADNTSFKRVINVVYDDSGSMISMNGQKYDTWCQAKYAMEVFASMLTETDTMNVYYMSDYDKDTKAKPRLVLKGADGIKKNVSKVHDTVTRSLNTPWRSVQKAYSDLSKTDADEKWLVVLTDGEFEGVKVDEVNKFFDSKDNDIKVMLLSMGSKGASINSNPSKDIYYEKASSSKDVLSKLTTISTRVFNRDRLTVSSNTINFDVPMSQLIVFAQGKNVNINSIKDAEGQTIQSIENVGVKYSSKAAINYSDVKIDTNLVGQIAMFEGDFDAGKYTIDVTEAETVEVYYIPNVEIAAYLTNSNGDEVTDLANLEAGTYKINFGFVKGGTSTKVPESKLLGTIKYEAIVTNNDKTHEKTYTSGDEIYLDEGTLKIEAIARFLEYNTVSTTLDYQIFENKNASFEVITNHNYIIKNNKIFSENSEEILPIKIKITLNGVNVNEGQWESMGVPTITFDSNVNKGFFQSFYKINTTIDSFSVEKSEEVGVFDLYPHIEDFKSKKYVGVNYNIDLNQTVGEATWTGSGNGTLNLQDERSPFAKYFDLIIKLAITFGIIMFFVGYIPGIKKYLPKSLKSRFKIRMEAKRFGKGRPMDIYGFVDKYTLSTILPYIPQTGIIRFPSSISGIPPMSIKAVGNKKFRVTNFKSYVGKNITFNGSPVDEAKKKMDLSSGVIIVIVDEDYKYTGSPRN